MIGLDVKFPRQLLPVSYVCQWCRDEMFAMSIKVFEHTLMSMDESVGIATLWT